MNSEIKKKEYGLNRGNLKMIALFCMTLDHFAVAIIVPWLRLYDTESLEYAFLSTTMSALRLIGRLAFPIFCFFIVEGLLHTRSVFKYAVRLFIFAIISEVPFDMVLKHTFFTVKYQNVFWTMLIGLVAIYILDGIYGKFKAKAVVKDIVTVFISALALYTAEVFSTDYGAHGVLTIIVIYLIGKNRYRLILLLNILVQLITFFVDRDFTVLNIVEKSIILVLSTIVLFIGKMIVIENSRKMFAACVILSAMNLSEVSAFANVYLMQIYNGQKGRNIRWLFYLFYPLHLAALAGLCMLVGLY